MPVHTSPAPESAAHSSTGASTASILVEVVLTITLLGSVDEIMTVVVNSMYCMYCTGLAGFAAFLGWKHYSARRGLDSYRLFSNNRSDSVVSSNPQEPVASYNNPVYQSNLLDQITRRDSTVEVRGFPW